MLLKKLLLVLLLVLLFNAQASNSRFTSKWDHLKSPNMRCRILTPKEIQGHSYVKRYMAMMARMISEYNCTLVITEKTHQGGPDENGTYDGWAGSIQRNEADIAMALYRFDSVPFEPGKFTPPYFPADIAIFSLKTKKATIEQRQITAFLRLGTCVYAYVFTTCFFIFPTIYSFFQLERKDRLKPHKFARKYLFNCFRVFTLLVDQEQLEPASAINSILALAMSIFSLAAVAGILLNTVGADLVVTKEPPVIDSIDDLVNDPQFAYIKPYIFKNYMEQQLLESAPPGSNEHKLWKRIKENKKGLYDHTLFYDQNYQNGGFMADLPIMTSADTAFILVERFARLLKTMACYAKQMKDSEEFMSLVDQLHLSKQPFGGSSLNGLYSHKVHPYIEKIFLQLCGRLFETGWADSILREILPNFSAISSLPVNYNLQFLKCAEGVVEDEQGFIILTAEKMQSVFEMWIFSSLGLSFFLILEVIFGRYCLKPWTRFIKSLRHKKRGFNVSKRNARMSIAATRRAISA